MKRKFFLFLTFWILLTCLHVSAFAESEGIEQQNDLEIKTEMKQGFVNENDKRYFYVDDIRFKPEKAGIYLLEDKYYYVFTTGSIKQVSYAGLYKVFSKVYYFYKDDTVAVVEEAGVNKAGTKYYYFRDDNSIKVVSTSGTYKIDGNLYYLFANDSVKRVSETGVQKINGRFYYFTYPDKVLFPGEGKHKVKGKYYYFREDGSLYSGWKTIDGIKGYYTSKGAKTGKCTIHDYVYYFTNGAHLIDSKRATIRVQKRNGKKFEIRSQAKQETFGYDTLQGSCTDGTYAYYVLYNRSVEKCKIAKVRISTNKVVKVSKVLNIGHGNGLTYNSKQKYLVAVHNTVYPKRLSVIDKKTLKVKWKVNVKIPSKLEGATSSQVKNIRKFGSISYNRKRNVYVVLLSNSHDLMILNSSFKPISYTKLSKKPPYIWQCIDVTDDYVMIGMSPNPNRSDQPDNIITIYEWDGKHRFTIQVKAGDELESIYHIGPKLYAGFYTNYLHPYTWTERKAVKSGRLHMTKRVKKTEYRLVRSNHVYRVSNYGWEID